MEAEKWVFIPTGAKKWVRITIEIKGIKKQTKEWWRREGCTHHYHRQPLWMRVEIEKEAKNGLFQKDPWMGQQSLWMRVEVEKEAKNDLL